MTRFLELTVLLCVTSVLTSNVKETQETHEQAPSALNGLFGVPDASATRPTVEDGRTAEHGVDSQQRNIAEGGPIKLSSSSPATRSEPVSSNDSGNVTKGIYLNTQDLIPDLEDEVVRERSSKSTVVARKGVENNADPHHLNETKLVTSVTISTSPGTHLVIRDPKVLSDTVGTKINKSDSDFKMQSGNDTAPTVTPALVNKTLQSTTIRNMVRRPKPKPTITTIIGDGSNDDVDKPISSFPTKTPSIGMPRKMDYIVPAAITIMAVPLLGVAAFVLYSRGRDCWEKRHYRRMDFLIDGMYND